MIEEQEKMLKHFSHQHPLEYVTSRFDRNRICSACRLTITPNNFFYHCKLCQFSLHKVCYTMPKEVMHPADQNHYLNLTTSCITDQPNDCKACGRQITGFCYNCTKCSLYYHMLCIALPLSVKIPSSHPHILKLELKPPYDFRCDLCEMPSYSGWLYRCRLCEFDAHVSCAIKGTRSPHQRSVPQIYSLEDDTMKSSKSHQHELMELLSEVMKGIEAKNLNLNQPQLLDQSTPISEYFTLPSYQFSDACFSIDISKSILVEENRNKASVEYSRRQFQHPDTRETQEHEILEVVKRQSSDFGEKDLKRELSLAPLTGTASHAWEKLEENVTATNVRVKLKAQSKRPFWLKLLMCF